VITAWNQVVAVKFVYVKLANVPLATGVHGPVELVAVLHWKVKPPTEYEFARLSPTVEEGQTAVRVATAVLDAGAPAQGIAGAIFKQ
jgi:hypothetical protein